MPSRLSVAGAMAIVMTLAGSGASANDGDLDAGFNGTGEAQAFVGSGANASAVLVRSDGKVVLVGINVGGSAIGVARFMADGSADLSFGTNGLCTVDRPSGSDILTGRAAAAHDATGRIVIGATAAFGLDSYMYVVRLTGECAFDTSFNVGGKRLINRGLANEGDSLAAISVFADPQAAAADSWILVAGAMQDQAGSGSQQLAVVPLHADGSYITDTIIDGPVGNESFLASTGPITFAHFYRSTDPGGNGYDAAAALARRWYPATASETIAIAGNVFSVSCSGAGCGAAASPHFANVLELDHFLQPIASFGAAGRSEFGFGSASSRAYSIALDDANRVVAAGQDTQGGNMGVARVLTTGYYDTSFAGVGYQLINFFESSTTYSAVAEALAIQHDGKILLGGYVQENGFPGDSDFCIVRLLPGGGRDAIFTGGGTIISGAHKYQFNGTAGDYYAYSMAFTAGEKILLSGQIGQANASFGVLQALNDRIFGDGVEAPVYLPRIP